jgi:hypothetical protein
VISKLAASVAASTTKAETASRVKNNKWGDDRPYDAKMGPCRFCGGGHAQASRLPHPEDSLSKATYPSTCGSPYAPRFRGNAGYRRKCRLEGPGGVKTG